MLDGRRLGLCLVLFVLSGCSRSTAYWTAQLKSDDPVARRRAIQALQERGEAEVVVPALTEALKDEDHSVRRDAARALGHFGPAAKEAVPALVVALGDKEPSVRKAAAEALKKVDTEGTTRGKVR